MTHPLSDSLRRGKFLYKEEDEAAADELDRLQDINDDLLAALEAVTKRVEDASNDFNNGYDAAVCSHLNHIEEICSAAIAKAKGIKE